MTHADRTVDRASERTVALDIAGRGTIHGDLVVPENARGIVLFAHGSGSSRHSPRNRNVARQLQRRGLATVLVDLLTGDEEREDARTGHLRFDIGLLADRLRHLTGWLVQEPSTARLPLGYFGASTGAAAALDAAAQMREHVAAIVSRGGRPDLATRPLVDVTAPTLLIVGGRDDVVLELNEQVLGALRCARDLRVVDGATHLFEEPGALDQVSRLAGDWFVTHMQVPLTGWSHRGETPMAQIELRSPDFEHDAFIPERHSHDGGNVSPAVEWIGVPADTVELLLLCEDPDAPSGTFLHWLVTGIDSGAAGVPENNVPLGGREWPNSFGETGWGGPAPPPGHGIHHYIITVYALARPVELPAKPTVDDVHRAVEGITLGQGSLVGLYQR
jgi:Raf kinase inhibitor-like YbhB/YbcL family protein